MSSDEYAELAKLFALDAVPELKELTEWEPPNEDDPDAPLLLRDELDPAAAIGADTLLVWFALGRGKAMVTAWLGSGPSLTPKGP